MQNGDSKGNRSLIETHYQIRARDLSKELRNRKIKERGKQMKRVKWGNVAKLVIAMYLVISVIGIATCEPYTEENGNVCRGYEFFQICSGNINLE